MSENLSPVVTLTRKQKRAAALGRCPGSSGGRDEPSRDRREARSDAVGNLEVEVNAGRRGY